MIYFAYGSNMHRARLEDRVGAVVDHGRAALPHYRHAFAKRGADGTGKGAIIAAVTARVLGVAYELSAAQLRALADYEGGYRRVEVRVDTGADAVAFEPLRVGDPIAPTAIYLGHYLAGMREHAFPDDYIQAVRIQAMQVAI